jgi:tripartite-type tricarboxylate transporter receptor subunit TctC
MAPSRREFVHLYGLATAAFTAPWSCSQETDARANRMKLPRRAFLHLAASAASLPAVSRIAWAEAYPTRPVHIVVGFSAGGGVDTIARLVGQWLSERLGQQFIIVNRPGAGSNIAAESVVKATPDGYTLLQLNIANAINATLYEKLNFDVARDIVPIAGIIRVPLVMVINPSFPARTVSEFIAYAKANPGKINMASAGNGSPQHIAGEQFKMMAGVNLTHVPYRGNAPALTDLIGGQVQVMFDTTPASIEHIRASQIRPLAVTTAIRSDVLPDLPTVGDFVPGYEASSWYGLGAPKNTPVEILHALNKEINAGLADPTMKAKLANFDGIALAGSPADFGKFMADETEKLSKVIRSAHLNVE